MAKYYQCSFGALYELILLNAFAAQGGIFLFPFIFVGIWRYRKDERVQFASLAWLGLLFGDDCYLSVRRTAWRILPFGRGAAIGLVGARAFGLGVRYRRSAEARLVHAASRSMFFALRWSASRF